MQNVRLKYNGKYTGFFNSSFPPSTVSQIERYTEIEIAEVTVNGTSCKYTTDKDARTAYTYYFATDEIDWFYPASSETVTFEATYYVKDLIKEHNNKAVMAWRFISLGFEKEIENIEIRYHLEDDMNMSLRNINRNGWSGRRENGCFVVSSNGNPSTDLLMVSVETDLDAVDGPLPAVDTDICDTVACYTQV